MISLEITAQGWLFLYGIFCGSCLLLTYDMLRIWRRVVKHGVVWMAVEDVIYWCFCACVIFAMLYRQNDGRIRGFVMLAIALGMLLYHFCFSRHVLKGGVAVLRGVIKVLHAVCKVLFAPEIFVCKKISKMCKKQLKKVWKAIRMGLCKL